MSSAYPNHARLASAYLLPTYVTTQSRLRLTCYGLSLGIDTANIDDETARCTRLNIDEGRS
ncbi:hypothetical protein N7452_004153 [Penicillium brevicompactum]|uniref:Uncharacterized protein n=1 Tax=Penicillium brevicompactum TaxID=5074 RepID=A0A9W9UMB1_PENBR|nr:hypothetical protein N7452_004153 [Penicillium brevicompactum]